MEFDLEQIRTALERDAVWVVFVNVLLQQLGLPVPVLPTLLVAGSLAATPGSGAAMLGAAVVASVIADLLWYLAGRAFGYRVLSGLCRLSINPETCVTQTELRFGRWGPWSLLAAKFVPGFSTVAPPIAGALRMPATVFTAAAGAGAALWAGAALAGGWLLRDELHLAIAAIGEHAAPLLAALVAGLALWLGWKFWRRHRFMRLAAMPHVTAAELIDALASERPPRVLDLRGAAMIAEAGPFGPAIPTTLDTLLAAVGDWPRDGAIVTFCACPQDASAVRAASLLLEAGYSSARPVRGGYHALIAASRRAGKGGASG